MQSSSNYCSNWLKAFSQLHKVIVATSAPGQTCNHWKVCWNQKCWNGNKIQSVTKCSIDEWMNDFIGIVTSGTVTLPFSTTFPMEKHIDIHWEHLRMSIGIVHHMVLKSKSRIFFYSISIKGDRIYLRHQRGRCCQCHQPGMPWGRALHLWLQPCRPAPRPAAWLAVGRLWRQRALWLQIRQRICRCQGAGEELPSWI